MQRLAASLVMIAVGLSLAPPPICECSPDPAAAQASQHPCCAAARTERVVQGALRAPCTSGCCDPHLSQAPIEPPARAHLVAPTPVALPPVALLAASAWAPTQVLAEAAHRRAPPPTHARRLAWLQLRRC